MNNSWARPGVRCVCINDRLFDIQKGELNSYVTKGVVYKVVSVKIVEDQVHLGLWGMPLGCTFVASAFRPLIETSNDATADTALFLEIAGHASDLESEGA